MKKLIATTIICCFAFTVRAQDNNFDPLKDRQLYFDILNICGVLAVMYVVTTFIMQVLKHHYNYRIKNRMLDKGTEENIVRQLLQPEKKENKNETLQWFCMMAAIGAGLILVSLTRPFGLHSLAILAFSVAAGFGAYYYFTRQPGKAS